MIKQVSFHLSAKRRGCHLVTSEVLGHLPKPLPQAGLLHLFVQHTSCALSINENADPDVKHDILKKLDSLLPRHESYYQHCEGNSAAHLKSSLFGVSLNVPVCNGKLHLGTWQGIYFCEFDGPRARKVEVYFQPAQA